MGWADQDVAEGGATDQTARAAAATAEIKAEQALSKAGQAETEADRAATRARAASSTADSAYTRTTEILQRLIGIDNNIEELLDGADVADWAQDENTDPIPADKLEEAVDQTARDSATQANQSAVALRPAVAANQAAVARLPIFGTYYVSPPGLPSTEFPEFMSITLANKLSSKTIAAIRVVMDGILLARVADPIIQPFNERTTLDSEGVGVGGIINIEISQNNRDLLQANRASGAQYARIELQFQFAGESTGNRFDHRDVIHIGTNNNSFGYVAPKLVGRANFNIVALNRFYQGSAGISLPTSGWGCIHFGRPSAQSAPVDFSHYRIDFSQINGLNARTAGQSANNRQNGGVIYASATTFIIGRTSANRLLVAAHDNSGLGNRPAEVWRF